MSVLAQGSTDITSVWLQYGALGAITLCALGAVRVLFQREAKSLDLERQRADRLEEELRQLNNSIHEKYVPALTRSAEVLTRVTEAITRLRESHEFREFRDRP